MKYFLIIAVCILGLTTQSLATANKDELEKIILDGFNHFNFEKEENNYSLPLTKEFIHSVFVEQQHELDVNCAGEDRDDEICGMDYSPVVCAQDVPDKLEIEITHEDADKISATLKNPPAKYQFVLHEKKWLIDGVDCDGDPRFNWKE